MKSMILEEMDFTDEEGSIAENGSS